MSLEARNWIFDILVNSSEIASHVGNRIYSASSMGIDPDIKPPIRPFLVYRKATAVPGMRKRTEVVPFVFYVHDDQGSFVNHIDPTLKAIRVAVESRAPQLWNGKQFFDARWEGDSDDLYDDMFRTATKYTTINVVVES